MYVCWVSCLYGRGFGFFMSWPSLIFVAQLIFLHLLMSSACCRVVSFTHFCKYLSYLHRIIIISIINKMRFKIQKNPVQRQSTCLLVHIFLTGINTKPKFLLSMLHCLLQNPKLWCLENYSKNILRVQGTLIYRDGAEVNGTMGMEGYPHGTEITFRCIASIMGEKTTWKLICEHGNWVGKSFNCGKCLIFAVYISFFLMRQKYLWGSNVIL